MQGAGDRYGVMVHECYHTFQQVVAYEQRRYGTPLVHRLLLDACAVQHPPRLAVQIIQGIEKRLISESVQRVTLHLVGLYLAFEKRMPLSNVSKEVDLFMAHAQQQNAEFMELQPPSDLGSIKIVDIWHGIMEQPLTLDEYSGLITKFAERAWDAWSTHHSTIRRLYEKYK